jgi:acetylornithine deacetylase
VDGELEIRYPAHPFCPQGITVTPGVLFKSGVFYGILPGYAEFSVEIRTVPGMRFEDVEADVQAFVGRLRAEDPTLEIEFEFEPLPLGWIQPVEVSLDQPFVASLTTAAKQVLGFQPRLNAFPAWTDARFFAEAGITTIPAFGPGLLTVTHMPNEHIAVESIVRASKIYALAAWSYLSGSEPS